ncbi:putative general vesicular transport factor [Apostichopus japonicus]|uniref:General vesicular transport factor p115 n=1 Tax=Stichopus japonicus TaxID=307972 RepID=A0A2G8LQK6_STIJA|nr:putative general vesicular transport factor [Apostichopus japonicus]
MLFLENVVISWKHIGKLCDRVKSSTLLDDRRDAVRALKALSKKFRLEVGTQAMDLLIHVLQTDSSDSEITGYALDTIYNIVSVQPDEIEDEMEENQQQPKIDQEQASLAKQFAEIFINKPENVAQLLGLLEEFDFHVRWPAIKLLMALIFHHPPKLQQCILVSPMGVSKLMDLLADSRDVIRNDGLLLLIHLTKGNANIQKIVAFENAFDRLLEIIKEEGSSDGGIVVEDCLLLLLNLLKKNSSNQTFFKEGSFIQRLAPFFNLQAPESGNNASWSAQKVNNVNLMLQVVRCLVSPSNPQNVTGACQKVIHQCGLLKQLCDILMAMGVPANILTETLNTVSEVIRGFKLNQEFFAAVNAPSEPPRPALVVLLMSMVNEKQPFDLRCAVLYCFQCFLYKNDLGQEQIISTLLPATADVSSVTAGQLLCGGLFSQDALSNWCSAIALSHALKDNVPQKEQLLRVQLAAGLGNPPVSLLQQCTNVLSQPANKVQTNVGFLVLLSSWLANCPLAVTHFLANPGNVPFLTAEVAENADEDKVLVQGLCAFLLGLCIHFNDDSNPSFTKESMRQLIAKRIGVESFVEKLENVMKHESYTLAAQKPQLRFESPDNMLFDYEFTTLFKQLESTVIKSANSTEEAESKKTVEEHDNIVTQYKEIIRDQDMELSSLRETHKTLNKDYSEAERQLGEYAVQIQQLKDQYILLKAQNGDSSNIQENGPSATAALTVPDQEQAKENERLKREIEELQKSQETLSQQLAEKETNIDKLTNDNSALIAEKAAMSTQISKLESDLAKLTIEKEKLSTEKDRLAKEKEQMREEMEAAKASSGPDQGGEVEQLRGEKEALEEKVKEAEAMQERLQKEQDDLLVLLSETDEKKLGYKEKLKELGGQISEEEMEDDDDDEDYDDDEDEED